MQKCLKFLSRKEPVQYIVQQIRDAFLLVFNKIKQLIVANQDQTMLTEGKMNSPRKFVPEYKVTQTINPYEESFSSDSTHPQTNNYLSHTSSLVPSSNNFNEQRKDYAIKSRNYLNSFQSIPNQKLTKIYLQNDYDSPFHKPIFSSQANSFQCSAFSLNSNKRVIITQQKTKCAKSSREIIHKNRDPYSFKKFKRKNVSFATMEDNIGTNNWQAKKINIEKMKKYGKEVQQVNNILFQKQEHNYLVPSLRKAHMMAVKMDEYSQRTRRLTNWRMPKIK